MNLYSSCSLFCPTSSKLPCASWQAWPCSLTIHRHVQTMQMLQFLQWQLTSLRWKTVVNHIRDIEKQELFGTLCIFRFLTPKGQRKPISSTICPGMIFLGCPLRHLRTSGLGCHYSVKRSFDLSNVITVRKLSAVIIPCGEVQSAKASCILMYWIFALKQQRCWNNPVHICYLHNGLSAKSGRAEKAHATCIMSAGYSVAIKSCLFSSAQEKIKKLVTCSLSSRDPITAPNSPCHNAHTHSCLHMQPRDC